MAAKIQKLQNQFREDTPGEGLEKGPITNIFKGISIFVNGYTSKSMSKVILETAWMFLTYNVYTVHNY